MPNAPVSPAAVLFAQAQFVMSCARLAQLPQDTLPEIAFVGRSNAGKSSALNALCQQRALARVSKTPGRTQLINLFAMPQELARLVDLPGYGFAAVPGAIKQDWAALIGDYLEQRRNLLGLVMMMDIRHPLTPLDIQMLDWARATGKATHILLTKADKLSFGPAKSACLAVQRALPQYCPGATVQLFSAHSHLGVADAQNTVLRWIKPGDA